MTTAKQTAEAMLRAMPDDASFEEIQDRLYLLGRIEAGLADAEAGRTHGHDAIKAQLAAWRAR